MKRIVVGISGASSMLYAKRFLYFLSQCGVEIHLVISKHAQSVIIHELSEEHEPMKSITQYAHHVYEADSFFSPIASGSFLHDGMIVIPCSMNTLAHIAQGITHSLLHRAADVCIKEQRPLVVVPRESPYSTIHLRNMLALSEQGVAIMPPTLALYHKPSTIEEGVDSFIFRVLDIVKIQHTFGKRWGESV